MWCHYAGHRQTTLFVAEASKIVARTTALVGIILTMFGLNSESMAAIDGFKVGQYPLGSVDNHLIQSMRQTKLMNAM
jgi:uncharacterized membrane protein